MDIMNFSSNKDDDINEKELRRNKRHRKMRYHENEQDRKYLDGPQHKNKPYRRERERFDQYEDSED